LAGALARQRDAFNARFAAARSASPLDSDAFGDHLATVVEPIVASVAAIFAEKVDAVTAALFDVSLELFAAKLLGPDAKESWVTEAWRRLLPSLPLLVAREPDRTAACVSNAIVNLSGTDGARPEFWIDRILAVGPVCSSVHSLLDCGAVAAWQAGMAHYRAGALDAAGRIPPPLAARSLGLDAGTSAERMAQILGRLRDDPWLIPAQAAEPTNSARALTIVRRVGAFRGFGGPFLRPPSVSCSGLELVVSDGEGAWRMLADACGAVLIRIQERPSGPGNGAAKIDAHGRIRWGDESADFPELAGAQTYAAAGHTLAVTLPTSHQVLLLAKTPVGGGEPRGGSFGAA